jgi:hypothetical protein
LRRFGLAAALAAGIVFQARAVLAAEPWLFVSDIHFDPAARGSVPASYGFDTNLALLDSALAEMRRVDPDPPVIVIAGDFLAHHFHYVEADATMKALAARFDRAFPRAQFVIALGNEDSGCGNYQLSARAPFLRTVAAAWQPLVNRRAAAPAFARTFAQDGFYTATLPLAHLHAVVIDDVFWSPRYRAACGGTSAARRTIDDLRTALRAWPHDPKWVIAHIPPGVDAFSTIQLARQLVVVPFLEPAPRDELLRLIDDPRARVTAMLASHTHKFAYRIDAADGSPAVPIVLVPSISPIFHNAPSFLTVDVLPDGTLGAADDHTYLKGRWSVIGGSRTLGLARISGTTLLDLQARLSRDAGLRRRYARLYDGGARPEIDERHWRAYWCTSTAFSTDAYVACIGRTRGYSVVTRRGLIVFGAAIVTLALAGALLVRRYRRTARRDR